MSDIADFLLALRDRGIRCRADGDKLRCDAPPGALDAETRQALTRRKQEILDYLNTASTHTARSDGLVAVKRGGDRPPLFFLSGDSDNIYCVASLATHLAADQPVYFVPPSPFDDSRPVWNVEAVAQYEVKQLLKHSSGGPFLLAGHCAGGYVAFEVARLLRQAGHEVAVVALIDCIYPTPQWPQASRMGRITRHLRSVTTGPWSHRLQYVRTYIGSKLRHVFGLDGAMHAPPPSSSDKMVLVETMRVAIRQYNPGPYDRPLDVFFALQDRYDARRWRRACPTLNEHAFETSLHELRSGPHVPLLAAALQVRLDAVIRTGGASPALRAVGSSSGD